MPIARVRYLRVAPPKVRHVLGIIRGCEVDDARERLRFCERGAAEPVLKLLDSAIANAENNDHLPPDELYVEQAFCDEGPTLKRWRPRARGRATRINKRTSHITIVVSRFTDDELQRRRRIEELKGGGGVSRRPTRRRRLSDEVRAQHGDEHEHEHDHEHENDGADDDAGEEER
jgi:large subunit ribosomal protein L22